MIHPPHDLDCRFHCHARSQRRLLVVLLLTSWTVLPGSAVGQTTPEKTLQQIQVKQPEAAVSLFAAEPMVQNPTSIAVDSRGRIWVTEGLNYRLWVKFQQGKFQRVPGADRIKILEDTNGDGRADKVTVFAENIFPVPMGLAIEERWEGGTYRGCRVYVGNSPNLLLLEDRDGDDRADHREPLLSGFRGVDSDHGIHGLQLGIDGWLYFTVGDTRYGVNHNGPDQPTFDVTDRSGRRLVSARYGTVCRVRPDGTQMEVLGHRLRNDYEVCSDSFGHRFLSDNDDDGQQGCRVCWVLPGGNFGYRMPGARLHNAEEMPGVVPKIAGTGNGSPCGLLVYEGTLFRFGSDLPLLEVDAGTRQINLFPLQPYGAAFRTEYQTWLSGSDDWFRPIDLDVAPDGSIYLCDWYDAGVGGNRVSDQTTGRVYRIAPPGHVAAVPQWDAATVDGALTALRSPNRATQLAGRSLLLQHGESARPALSRLAREGRLVDRARALWVLFALDADHPQPVIDSLDDRSPLIRELAVKILTEDAGRDSVISWPDGKPAPPRAVQWLAKVLPLRSDPSPLVRRQLLTGLRAVDTKSAGDALIRLALSWDGQDRYYLEALRLALVDREADFLRSLFARLGERIVAASAEDGVRIRDPLAIPPYYPVSANNAFFRPSDRLPPASPTTRLAGIAWALQRSEAVGALRIAYLNGSCTQDERTAIERALSRIADPRSALVVMEALERSTEPAERVRLFQLLTRHVDGVWEEIRQHPRLSDLARSSLQDSDLHVAAVELIAAARLSDFQPRLREWASDTDVAPSLRAASLKALAIFDVATATRLAKGVIEEAIRGDSDPVVVPVALELVGRRGKEGESTLVRMLTDGSLAGELRRRAALILSYSPHGARRLLELVQQRKLDDHWSRTVLALVANHPDVKLRKQAREQLQQLGGIQHRLVDFDAVLARPGNAAAGRKVFFASSAGGTACGSCHRVQGIGDVVGPDLSTIGTKYGKRELLFHITQPSAVINHNYTGEVLQLEDGRVVSGIVVAGGDGKVVLKTTQAERVELAEDEIVARKTLDESVMPNNLCDTLSDQQLADLLAFLAQLRTPVIEVGLARVLGPVSPHVTLATPPPFDFSRAVPDPAGAKRHWNTVQGDREGRLRLPPPEPTTAQRYGWLAVELQSDVEQEVRLTLSAAGRVEGFLNRSHILIRHHGWLPPKTASRSWEDARQGTFLAPRGRSILWLRMALQPQQRQLSLTLVPTRPHQLKVRE